MLNDWRGILAMAMTEEGLALFDTELLPLAQQDLRDIAVAHDIDPSLPIYELETKVLAHPLAHYIWVSAAAGWLITWTQMASERGASRVDISSTLFESRQPED